MIKNSIVIGIGEILWDIFPKGKKLGGAPVNFAFHCSQFGATGIPVSAIGDDDLGKEICQIVQNNKLDDCYISRDPNHPTGTVQVTLDSDGKPEYEICENVAWDFMQFGEKHQALAHQVKACCFGSLAQRCEVSRENIYAFLNAMPEGSIKIFDINLRQNFYTLEIIEKSLNIANILKISDEELPVTAKLLNLQGTDIEQLKQIREKYNLDIVIYSRGANGSVLLSATEINEHEGCPGKAINSVGAGDSFTATFCIDYLKGKSLKEINEHANRVATFVCMQESATPIFPLELINF